MISLPESVENLKYLQHLDCHPGKSIMSTCMDQQVTLYLADLESPKTEKTDIRVFWDACAVDFKGDLKNWLFFEFVSEDVKMVSRFDGKTTCQLRWLNLNGNWLTSIPQSLTKLTSLVCLG